MDRSRALAVRRWQRARAGQRVRRPLLDARKLRHRASGRGGLPARGRAVVAQRMGDDAATRGFRLSVPRSRSSPGLVLLTGLGWLILLDLSANGHFGTRYLALYHQGHLWLGMLIFTLAAFARQTLGRILAWCLSLVDGVASRVGARLGTLGSAVLLLCIALLLNAAIAAALLN